MGSSRDTDVLNSWTVEGNGDDNGGAWVDVHGLCAGDRKIGKEEYDSRCDYASPTQKCGYSCKYHVLYKYTILFGKIENL